MILKHQNEIDDDLENKEVFYMVKANTDGKLPSPINLSLKITTTLRLPEDLEWRNVSSLPQKIHLKNSGKSVVVTGQWTSDRPTLRGGFLPGDYVFSQVHFHWGKTVIEGSEHKINGSSFPLEMHVVWYRSCYESLGVALTCPDGVVVVVYLATLARQSCPILQQLSEHLTGILQPRSSMALPLAPLSSFLVPFSKDYVAYWGAINTDLCSHPLLWMMCRTPLAISSEDLKIWRTLLDFTGKRMGDTFGVTYSAQGRTVFLVNPSGNSPHLLHPYNEDPEVNVISLQGELSANTCKNKRKNRTFLLSTTQGKCTKDKAREKMERSLRSISLASLTHSSSPPTNEGLKLTKKDKDQFDKEVMFTDIPFIINMHYNNLENEINVIKHRERNVNNTERKVPKNINPSKATPQTMPRDHKPIGDNHDITIFPRKIEQLEKKTEISKSKFPSRIPLRTTTKYSHIQSSLKLTSKSDTDHCMGSKMNSSMSGLNSSYPHLANTKQNSVRIDQGKLKKSTIPRRFNTPISRFHSSGLD